jgi:uncharacterized protein YyaL (SSP411 family)
MLCGQEIEEALGGREAAALFCHAYNIKDEGNCTLSDISDPHEEFSGKNVPIILKPLQELATEVRQPLICLVMRMCDGLHTKIKPAN